VHDLSARGSPRQQDRARLADLESLVGALPGRFNGPRLGPSYRYVNKTAHGFAIGTVVRPDATTWGKSQADTAANAIVAGIVVSVPHANAFVVAFPGTYVRGLTSLTAGAVHFLDATTAGALTTTAPAIAVPILLANTTTSGVVMSAWPGGGVAAPTEDGLVFASDSGGTAGEWVRDLDLGKNATGKAGVLRVRSPDAGGDAVVIDGALVTASGKKLTVREVDVCDAGVAKKMLVLGSAPY
jgi:hypothetical protein